MGVDETVSMHPIDSTAEPVRKKAETVCVLLSLSESVNDGHPDKRCELVSGAVLDACLANDPRNKVDCETAAEDDALMVAGKLTVQTKVDYEKVVPGVVA